MQQPILEKEWRGIMIYPFAVRPLKVELRGIEKMRLSFSRLQIASLFLFGRSGTDSVGVL